MKEYTSDIYEYKATISYYSDISSWFIKISLYYQTSGQIFLVSID